MLQEADNFRSTTISKIMNKTKVAIIGSGNIGTDLMIKILRTSKKLELSALVGIDPNPAGLARARRIDIKTTHTGIEGLLKMPEWREIDIIFDATSAKAHQANYELLKQYHDKRVIDLTPAAIGPYVVPSVNMNILTDERNFNMVTCGGQATIPIIASISKVTKVHYGEIVASIASKSAGPGTRANIDEFTETTARGVEEIGGAERGKAIIILNPSEPPLMMRDTVFTLSEQGDREAIQSSIQKMVTEVQRYVPGYELHQEVQFEEVLEDQPILIEGLGYRHGLKTMVLLKVRGAGHYLPEYAGNLDIMTSAALATGENLAQQVFQSL